MLIPWLIPIECECIKCTCFSIMRIISFSKSPYFQHSHSKSKPTIKCCVLIITNYYKSIVSTADTLHPSEYSGTLHQCWVYLACQCVGISHLQNFPCISNQSINQWWFSTVLAIKYQKQTERLPAVYLYR